MKKIIFMPNFDERLFGLLVVSVKNYAIFMIAPQGMILSCNQDSESIKGYKEDEISGKHISIFTPFLERIYYNFNAFILNNTLKYRSFQHLQRPKVRNLSRSPNRSPER